MKLIDTKIAQIRDPSFRSLVNELCMGVSWDPMEYHEKTLAFLIIEIMRRKKTLTRPHLPVDGILTTKVGKISENTIIHDVCRELAQLSGAPLEAFETKNVLTLIQATMRFYKKALLRKGRQK